jgi:hypothetical protein
MQITLDIPQDLEADLAVYDQELLPDLLIEQLRTLWTDLPKPTETETTNTYYLEADEVAIMQTLASRPTAETILALQPSATMQTRVSALLAKQKWQSLSPNEARELDRYFILEHLVRLAKAQAYRDLQMA